MSTCELSHIREIGKKIPQYKLEELLLPLSIGYKELLITGLGDPNKEEEKFGPLYKPKEGSILKLIGDSRSNPFHV